MSWKNIVNNYNRNVNKIQSRARDEQSRLADTTIAGIGLLDMLEQNYEDSLIIDESKQTAELLGLEYDEKLNVFTGKTKNGEDIILDPVDLEVYNEDVYGSLDEYWDLLKNSPDTLDTIGKYNKDSEAIDFLKPLKDLTYSPDKSEIPTSDNPDYDAKISPKTDKMISKINSDDLELAKRSNTPWIFSETYKTKEDWEKAYGLIDDLRESLKNDLLIQAQADKDAVFESSGSDDSIDNVEVTEKKERTRVQTPEMSVKSDYIKFENKAKPYDYKEVSPIGRPSIPIESDDEFFDEDIDIKEESGIKKRSRFESFKRKRMKKKQNRLMNSKEQNKKKKPPIMTIPDLTPDFKGVDYDSDKAVGNILSAMENQNNQLTESIENIEVEKEKFSRVKGLASEIKNMQLGRKLKDIFTPSSQKGSFDKNKKYEHQSKDGIFLREGQWVPVELENEVKDGILVPLPDTGEGTAIPMPDKNTGESTAIPLGGVDGYSKGSPEDTEISLVSNEVSHVNPYEKLLVDSYGQAGEDIVKQIGSGDRNLYTGLKQYGIGISMPNFLSNMNIGSGSGGGSGSGYGIGSAVGNIASNIGIKGPDFVSQLLGQSAGAIGNIGSSIGSSLSSAVSGVGASAGVLGPAMMAFNVLSGATKQADANKQQLKEAERALDALGYKKQGMEARYDIDMGSMQDSFQRTADTTYKQAGSTMNDLSDQVTKIQKSTRGLDTSSADRTIDNTLGKVQDTYSSSMDNLVQELADSRLKYNRDYVDSLQAMGLEMDNLEDDIDYLKDHDDWYENIF